MPIVLLAPMAGVTDISFRKLCVSMGAKVTVSEMISAKGLYYKDKKTAALMVSAPEEENFAVQLFGSEPEIVAYSAKKVIETNPNVKFIDINMGCPMPKITGNGEGSALMKTPGLAGKIVRAVADTGIPVTVKMRVGWDKNSINAPHLAAICEENGAKMLCVHGRTREQLYRPPVDYETIREVKKKVNIPVIANGGIYTADDALRVLDITGCDGIAIGQGAMGNPWIFRELNDAFEGKRAERPSQSEIIEMAKAHAAMLCEDKGDYIGIREARKHIGWYIKGMPGSAEARAKVNVADSLEEVIGILNGLKL